MVANAEAGSQVTFAMIRVCTLVSPANFDMDAYLPALLSGPKVNRSVTEMVQNVSYIKSSTDHLGPVIFYMASCDGDCTKFDTANAQWFKVAASGYQDGVWATTTLINSECMKNLYGRG